MRLLDTAFSPSVTSATMADHIRARWRAAACLLVLTYGACARGVAAVTSAPPERTAAASTAGTLDSSVPAHDSLTLQSRSLGEARPINVWTPPAYRTSSEGRFPVLYMPDGGVQEDFPHVVHTVDSLITSGAIRPVIVVGIPNTARRRDLTGPTRVAADSAIAPQVGGSAAFRRFIRDELMPAIDARYRTTEERAIIGESLAGLFIVETFLTESKLFTHYVALDPSLQWNDGALVNTAADQLAALAATPRTLYFATSSEGETTAGARLAALLNAATPPGLRWRYAPRADLRHSTIFRGLKVEALVHALQ